MLPPPTGVTVQEGSETLRWHWRIGSSDDGNWGLKSMRFPNVWAILARMKRADGTSIAPPKVAVLDSGFGLHPQLNYQNAKGLELTRPFRADCRDSHGTHVAGIIAAQSSPGKGIDGIVPDARLDIIPISRNLLLESAREGVERKQMHLSYFADVIRDLANISTNILLLPASGVSSMSVSATIGRGCAASSTLTLRRIRAFAIRSSSTPISSSTSSIAKRTACYLLPRQATIPRVPAYLSPPSWRRPSHRALHETAYSSQAAISSSSRRTIAILGGRPSPIPAAK